MNYNYGDAYLRHPILNGTAIFADGSALKTHDICNPLPEFMLKADMVFSDSPWNKGNLRAFYTKADMPTTPFFNFSSFMDALFSRISEIAPNVCYLEIGKEHLADYIIRMRQQFKYVTFYNSTYYHSAKNLCYVVRGSRSANKPSLDGLDEETIIERVCQEEKYSCVADLCMGRGLVAVAAARAGKRFVGTELNHRRLSVAVERVSSIGLDYQIVNTK